MRAALIALALTGLAACNTGPAAGPPATQVAVAQGTVTIAGPEGYCIDRGGSRVRSGFALLGPCAALGGETFPRRPAVLTAQVGQAGSAFVAGAEPPLVALLEGEGGPTLLGLTGGRIDDVQSGPGQISLRITQPEGATLPGTQSTEWRVLTGIGDRAVTLTVRGSEAEPLSAIDGELLLVQFLTATRLANAAPAADG